MTAADRNTLSRRLDVISFEAGDHVYKQGDPGDHFFVVVRGTVEELGVVTDNITGDLSCTPGAMYMTGQYFGEQSLVTETSYPTSMTCIGEWFRGWFIE